MDSTKIFIDTDTEITFILEKILASKGERVVLVIPDRASVLSSIIGLKLIKRVVDKSEKLLVFVTLDDVGAELAKKAGLCVVPRIGEIAEDAWEAIRKAKFEVMKKDSKPRYTPKVSSDSRPIFFGNESDEEKKPEAEPETNEKESLYDLVDEAIADETNVEEIKPVEETREVPEVELELDVDHLEKEVHTELAEIPEEKELAVLPEQNEIIEVPNEITPIDIDSNSIANPAPIPQNVSEMSSENPISYMTDDSNSRRIRKSTPKDSNISNLSFAVGKDVGPQKKKPFFLRPF